MDNQSSRKLLEGIIPPLVTPMLRRDELDAAGLDRLIQRVLKGGVHGIFILGTTGEAPSLSYRLRRDLIQRTCQVVAGRVPVLVGITDTSLVEAVHMARYAAEQGAAAVVTSAPYYFPAGQPELAEHIRQLVPELPLPLFLYNMPQMTKVQFEPDTLRELVEIQGIAGLKDSSGDLDYFRQALHVAKARPDWRIFMGPELLLVEAIRLGAHGGVNGGALIEPSLLVGLYEAARQNDHPRVAALQARLEQLGRLYKVGKHVSSGIKGIKCALSLMGICSDVTAEPIRTFLPPEREKVRELLLKLNLLKPEKS